MNGADNEGEYKYGTANASSHDTWNQFRPAEQTGFKGTRDQSPQVLE